MNGKKIYRILHKLDKKISAVEVEVQRLIDGIDKKSERPTEMDGLELRLHVCTSNLFRYPNNKEKSVEFP